MATYCPVCDKPLCGHLDSKTHARERRRRFMAEVEPALKTPLDAGVARFAADVIELLGAKA